MWTEAEQIFSLISWEHQHQHINQVRHKKSTTQTRSSDKGHKSRWDVQILFCWCPTHDTGGDTKWPPTEKCSHQRSPVGVRLNTSPEKTETFGGCSTPVRNTLELFPLWLRSKFSPVSLPWPGAHWLRQEESCRRLGSVRVQSYGGVWGLVMRTNLVVNL